MEEEQKDDSTPRRRSKLDSMLDEACTNKVIDNNVLKYPDDFKRVILRVVTDDSSKAEENDNMDVSEDDDVRPDPVGSSSVEQISSSDSAKTSEAGAMVSKTKSVVPTDNSAAPNTKDMERTDRLMGMALALDFTVEQAKEALKVTARRKKRVSDEEFVQILSGSSTSTLGGIADDEPTQQGTSSPAHADHSMQGPSSPARADHSVITISDSFITIDDAEIEASSDEEVEAIDLRSESDDASDTRTVTLQSSDWTKIQGSSKKKKKKAGRGGNNQEQQQQQQAAQFRYKNPSVSKPGNLQVDRSRSPRPSNLAESATAGFQVLPPEAFNAQDFYHHQPVVPAVAAASFGAPSRLPLGPVQTGYQPKFQYGKNVPRRFVVIDGNNVAIQLVQ